MIVWSGFGLVFPVVVFVFLLLGQLTADEFLGEGFYTDHMWVQGVSLMLGGVTSFAVGRQLYRGKGRLLVDPETGEEVLVGTPNHTFFWIPIHYGGLATAVLGLGLTIHGLL